MAESERSCLSGGVIVISNVKMCRLHILTHDVLFVILGELLNVFTHTYKVTYFRDVILYATYTDDYVMRKLGEVYRSYMHIIMYVLQTSTYLYVSPHLSVISKILSSYNIVFYIISILYILFFYDLYKMYTRYSFQNASRFSQLHTT